MIILLYVSTLGYGILSHALEKLLQVAKTTIQGLEMLKLSGVLLPHVSAELDCQITNANKVLLTAPLCVKFS